MSGRFGFRRHLAQDLGGFRRCDSLAEVEALSVFAAELAQLALSLGERHDERALGVDPRLLDDRL